MASNTNSPYGLKALRHINNGLPQINDYLIYTGDTNNIYTGDPVIVNGSHAGYITQGVGNESAGAILGVFVGCEYFLPGNPVKQFSKYWPASTTVASGTQVIAKVIDDPGIIFQVQVDSTAITQGFFNQNYNLNTVATSDAVSSASYGISSANLAGGTANSGYGYRALRLAANGTVLGAYADVEVIIANHALKG